MHISNIYLDEHTFIGFSVPLLFTTFIPFLPFLLWSLLSDGGNTPICCVVGLTLPVVLVRLTHFGHVAHRLSCSVLGI